MTSIADKMRSAGFAAHAVGKWDAVRSQAPSTTS